MVEFGHFILTRFNCRLDFGSGRPPDRDWLVHRFGLFDRFCYPSVRGQTCADFQWLVLFDVDTPAEFKAKVAEYARWENFVPCYVAAFTDFNLAAEIGARLRPGSAGVITTRLDNDDAIAREFVARIQGEARPGAFEFLNFPSGYVLQDDRLYLSRQPSNPFISLVEGIENIRTAWCAGHHELSAVAPIRQVQAPPMWLQVIHGRNLTNTLGRALRAPRRDLAARFAVNYGGDAPGESLLRLRLGNAANRAKWALQRLVYRARMALRP